MTRTLPASDKHWRCRVGWHAWAELAGGMPSIVIPSSIEYCVRCMVGRERYCEATFRYTPEEIQELLFKDMKHHGAEVVP